MIYIAVLFLLVILSFHYDINEKKENRDFWYLVCLLIFIFIAGLRWRLCVDTPNYINMFYHEYPTIQEFSWDDFSIGEDPLYVLINSIVKTCGGRFYMVQLIQASFVNILIFAYIKRHTSHIFTALLFYALTSYLGYNMDIMRASMAIAVSLFANDFFLEKKWIKGYLLVIIGCFFHAQTILLLILPFFVFLRFNKIGIIILLGGIFLGKIAQALLLDYMFLFDANEAVSGKMAGYLEDEKYGTQGGNFNFFIVNILPTLIYCVLSLLYLKWKNSELKILKLEPFLMFGFFFLIMQMSLQIAYRFVDFYRIYFVLFMGEAFVTWLKKSSVLSISVATLRTYIFFLPYFVFINWSYFTHFEWIYPYSSVIERSVDQRRESSYAKWDRPRVKLDEY